MGVDDAGFQCDVSSEQYMLNEFETLQLQTESGDVAKNCKFHYLYQVSLLLYAENIYMGRDFFVLLVYVMAWAHLYEIFIWVVIC